VTLFDKNLYVKNIIYNWGAYVVAIVVGFFLSPVIVRHLGDAGYGFWSMVVGFTGYFGYLDLGIQSAVGQYVSRHLNDGNREQLEAKANTALTVLSTLAFLALISVLVASFSFSRFFHVEAAEAPGVRLALLLMGVAMALKLPLAVFSAMLAGAQRFYLISGVSLGVKILNAALVCLVLSTHHGLKAFAAVVSGTQLLEGLLLVILAVRAVPHFRFRPFYFQRRAFGELFQYGFFNFLINLFGQGSALFATFLIGHKVAAEAVTYYSIGSELMPYMCGVVSAVTIPLLQIVIPMDVHADLKAMKTLLLTGTRYLFGLVCLIGLNLLVVGHAFLAQWMGDKYLDPAPYGSSGTVLTLLTAANVAALSSSVAQQILFGRRKNKLFAAFVVLETVATVLLAVLLVPQWGILGVAAATLIPMALFEGLVIPALTSSQVGTNILQYWREGILPNLVIAALVLAVSKALMPHVPGWGWARVFLSFTIVSAIHLTTCFFFLVEGEHKRRFASLILSRFAWVKS
jgi:O-antigen/teichoic acid export membrane protein